MSLGHNCSVTQAVARSPRLEVSKGRVRVDYASEFRKSYESLLNFIVESVIEPSEWFTERIRIL